MALFKYTDRELIKILKDKAKELGRSPKRREVYQNQVIRDRFGSWNEALIKANLKILKKKYTRNELIEYISSVLTSSNLSLKYKYSLKLSVGSIKRNFLPLKDSGNKFFR